MAHQATIRTVYVCAIVCMNACMQMRILRIVGVLDSNARAEFTICTCWEVGSHKWTTAALICIIALNSTIVPVVPKDVVIALAFA